MVQTEGKGSVVASLASLASLVAALSCCLPLGTLLLAAGSAGASVWAERLRPWLLVLAVAFVILAFVQTYVRRRCAFRYRRLRTVLLWFSAVVVLGMLAAPQFFANMLAGRMPFLHAAGDLRVFQTSRFEREFDAASEFPRLVVLFSPT